MAGVLIVDDDMQLCKALGKVMESMGHSAATAGFLSQGLDLCRRRSFDVVILDIRLPDGSGLDALPAFRECPDKPEVIILSGSSDPDGAELAIRSGAWSYIPKPPTLSKIRLPVERAIEYRRHKLSRSAEFSLDRCGIVGQSRALTACLDQVAQAARSDANVLVTGETGTGKELIARALHVNSARAKGPFVVVDCASLPDNLVESTLFGHQRGAFTGADRASPGLIREAHHGTLFLDEIGELPLVMQKAFLRVLQERRYRPVGGGPEVESDFRLVAATNRDLDEMVSRWAFRQDLLFRVRTILVEVPPLRERGGDVRPLAEHALARMPNGQGKHLSPEFLEALGRYHWPGNVRELMNAVQSAAAASGGQAVLSPAHLPMDIRVHLARTSISGGGRSEEEGGPGEPESLPTLRETRERAMEEVERQYLLDLLAATGGVVEESCRVSGLSRARFYALLKKYGVSRKAFREPVD
ncbi:sigma-54-dependent transcriptional regulator [Desulfohalovibrio reitneri]|uniref:sigma-54-dependent transcriptional regulator n=1 Tax=Desulfohalovibrio reitneri TaxID=1307759 RepID=UPI0004A77420|nr:sigma-54 dependent transcriptional regulator [Desulfohalovibrio reitneri]